MKKKKKILVPLVAVLAGAGLAVPLASSGATRAVTVITSCPAGITPPSPYCSEQSITTPDPAPPETTAADSTGSTTTTPQTTSSPSTSQPTATKEQVATARAAAAEKAGVPVTFVGQIGGALVFAPTSSPTLSSTTTSITVFAVQVLNESTVVSESTLSIGAGGRTAVVAKKVTLKLGASTTKLRAGGVTAIKITLSKAQKKTLAKKGGTATLTTKVSIEEAYGTTTSTKTTKLKVKKG